MSRAGKSGRLKKRNCCLTCSIVCFIIFIVFIATLFVGGTILFNKFVSPYIGGLTLNDALALSANALSGEDAESNYDEKDLDGFYSELSHTLYLKDKTQLELEYELVPDAKRRSLLDPDGAQSTGDYDEAAAYETYCSLIPASRYNLAETDLTEEEFLSLEASEASRDKAGLKNYRLDLGAIISNALSSEDEMTDVLMDDLSNMVFSFDTLRDYQIIYGDDDPEKEAKEANNHKLKVFTVNERQTGAFLNDILNNLLGSEMAKNLMKEGLSTELDLSEHIRIASVTIANNPLLSTGKSAAYDDKNKTMLAATLSVDVREIVNKVITSDAMQEQLAAVPSFAVKAIPNLVPKHFSVNVTVYPFAEEDAHQEMFIMMNKMSEKNGERLSTLLNALLTNDADSTRTFLCGVNDQVVATFHTVNDIVPLEFIPTKDLEGNDVSGFELMTWQAVKNLVVSATGASADAFSVDDILIVLKGIFITREADAPLNTTAAINIFKQDMYRNYGLDLNFFEESSLSTEALSDLTKHINIAGIDYTLPDGDIANFDAKNLDMRVRLPAEAIAGLLKQRFSALLSKVGSSSSASNASDPSSLAGMGLSVSTLRLVKIKKDDELYREDCDVYRLDVGVSLDLAAIIRGKTEESNYIRTLFSGVTENPFSLTVEIYLSEREADGKITHAVGSAIAEGEDGAAYRAKLALNDYSEKDTAVFLQSANRIVGAFYANSYDIGNASDKVAESLTKGLNVLSNNHINLRLYGAEEDPNQSASFKDDKGGFVLPSLFELVSDMTELRLNKDVEEDKKESFTPLDAWMALSLVHNPDVSYTKNYNLDNVDDALRFMNELNDKFYFSTDKHLGVSDLFGQSKSELVSKIDAASLDFVKLYSDDREIPELAVHLDGKNIAALVAHGDSALLEKVAGTYGDVSVLGARFAEEEGETYLYFDMQIKLGSKTDSFQYANLFPERVKISAKVHMTEDTLDAKGHKSYPTTLYINEDEENVKGAKLFLMLRAFAGKSLHADAISEKIGEAIGSAFNNLSKAHLTIHYEVDTTASDVGNHFVTMDDVFTLLVNSTSMKDSSEAENLTDPADLMNRLRGFGKQKKVDLDGTNHSWIGLPTFSKADYDYVEKNVSLAYFMTTTPTMNTFYSGFDEKFQSIDGSTFDLDGETGLFRYGDAVVKLKLTDKALGYIVHEQESAALGKAVAPKEGKEATMTVDLVSLRFEKRDTDYVIISGLEVSFLKENSMLPEYFFLITETTYGGDFQTVISLNELGEEETGAFFHNFAALGTKGLSYRFDEGIKNQIQSEISNAFKSAFSKMKDASFDTFSADDFIVSARTYCSTAYGTDISLPTLESGICLSFPSIYSFITDKFYVTDEEKAVRPSDGEMQHMICSLHAMDDDDSDALVVKNKPSGSSLGTQGYTGSSIDSFVQLYSDCEIGVKINEMIALDLVGDKSLTGGFSLEKLEQIILLSDTLPADKKRVWIGAEESYFQGATAGHPFMIATAKLPLAGKYFSGESINLIPENLYFSVLMDLSESDRDDAKALLFAMNETDMTIFTHIVNKYNNESENPGGFKRNAIAAKLDTLIRAKFNDMKLSAYGMTCVMEYHALTAGDDLDYYEHLIEYGMEEKIHHYVSEKTGIGYVKMFLVAE